MKFNTKLFLQIMAVFAILDACILMTACGNWESEAINIIGLLGPAVQSIIAILAALGVKVPAQVVTEYNDWAAQAQTALGNLKGLIASVQTAEAAAQPGLINEIDAGLQAVAANLQTILPELHIDDPASQAKVEEAMAAIIGFVGELAAIIPVIKSANAFELVGAKHKVDKAAENFKAAFNSAVSYFGNEYEIQ